MRTKGCIEGSQLLVGQKLPDDGWSGIARGTLAVTASTVLTDIQDSRRLRSALGAGGWIKSKDVALELRIRFGIVSAYRVAPAFLPLSFS